jgi:protein-tyrosine phosphatase
VTAFGGPSEFMTTRTLPCNVRDLGGLSAADDRRIRAGVLLRGDNPSRGDQQAQDQLQAVHGIRHVIDLRKDAELERGGDSFSGREEVTRHRVQMSMLDVIPNYPQGAPKTAEGLGMAYARHVSHAAASYVETFRITAEADGPVLIHCGLGKDRTGMVVAMILKALEVDDQTIIEDYALTADALEILLGEMTRRGETADLVISPASDARTAMYRADRRSMEVALRQLRTTHRGDPLAPLRAAGLDRALIARLRDQALSDPRNDQGGHRKAL